MPRPCKHCNKKIRIGVLCAKCKTNDDVIIDLTEVKRRYRLTDKDIMKSDIEIINIYSNWDIHSINRPGVRFFLKDVHALACRLTEKLDDSNPKKKAYKRQIATIERIDKEKTEAIDRYDRIKEMLLLSISKLNKPELVNLDKYDDMIKERALHDPSILNATDNIFDLIQKRHSRMLDLDSLINDTNREAVLNHPEYDKYVRNGGDLKKVTRIIKKDCSAERQRRDKILKINKFIDDNFTDKDDTKLLKRYPIYDQFVSSKISYNDCVKKMMRYIENIKEQKKRTQRLNYMINKKIKKKYHKDAKDTEIYKNYIEFGDLNKADIVIDKLVDYFKRKDRECVINNLPYSVQKIVKSSEMYKSYMNGDISINDLTDHVGFSKKRLYKKWKDVHIGRLDPEYDEFAKKIYDFTISHHEKIMWEGYDPDEMRIIRDLARKAQLHTVTDVNDMTIALYK